MFDTFPVIRFSPSVAVLLMIGVVVLSGCRCLPPKSSTAAPPVSPGANTSVHLPKMDEPDHYSAFRPIMPEQFMLPLPAEEIKIESKPDTIAQSKIDELNRKITELETQLAEVKKVPPVSSDDLSPPDLLRDEKTEIKRAKSLPIINRQGVHVYSDEAQHVRIEVMDKTLFMPNMWQLSAEGEETLRTIAAEIRAFDSTSSLDIEGHTDSLMSDPNNLAQKHDISAAKTRVVMDFFVNTLRWDIARIGTSSYGRSRPVADNGTPEGRAKNNRIEIVIRGGKE